MDSAGPFPSWTRPVRFLRRLGHILHWPLGLVLAEGGRPKLRLGRLGRREGLWGHWGVEVWPVRPTLPVPASQGHSRPFHGLRGAAAAAATQGQAE